MRKLILTTAAVAAAIELTGCGSGTFTDSRDGQTYKTVKIGTQIWMAQNLNYKPESGNSWCYNDDESMGEKYGRLYDWNTAKIACPKGWRLPSREDWGSLFQAVGGEKKPYDNGIIRWYGAGQKLKSESGWNKNGNGTNDFGFSALPGGYRIYYHGSFNIAGNFGIWWTATEYGSSSAYSRYMGYDNDYVDEGRDGKDRGYSVRCVANTP
jgi:uncharacterized protein (TIGR02145 family)